MTRPRAEVDAVLELARQGLLLPDIVRMTGIPRGTVRDWLAGKVSGRSPHRCWRCDPQVTVPQAEYVRLLGVYLGDGHIAHFPRRVFRLRLFQDARYVRLIREWADLAVVVLANKATIQPGLGCVAINSYSQHWPCLFPQHGPGLKHLRRIQLEEWQERLVDAYPRELLRGLIESDGSRSLNRVAGNGKWYEYSRYLFTNASADIRRVFTDTCDALGVHWTQMNARNIAVSRRADCDFLDTFIGPKS